MHKPPEPAVGAFFGFSGGQHSRPTYKSSEDTFHRGIGIPCQTEFSEMKFGPNQTLPRGQRQKSIRRFIKPSRSSEITAPDSGLIDLPDEAQVSQGDYSRKLPSCFRECPEWNTNGFPLCASVDQDESVLVILESRPSKLRCVCVRLYAENTKLL